MTTVQMPDSKLHRYTSYIVETIRFDNNNVCWCVNVKWVDASIEQYDGMLQGRTHLLPFITELLYKVSTFRIN